jgi:hypothetical protein
MIVLPLASVEVRDSLTLVVDTTGAASVAVIELLSLSLVLITLGVITVLINSSRVTIVTSLVIESLELTSITSLVVDPSVQIVVRVDVTTIVVVTGVVDVSV